MERMEIQGHISINHPKSPYIIRNSHLFFQNQHLSSHQFPLRHQFSYQRSAPSPYIIYQDTEKELGWTHTHCLPPVY